jgi:membrane protease subunit HflC
MGFTGTGAPKGLNPLLHDAEAARIYAEAYSGNAPFYDFVRTLEAYRKVIPQGTTLVLPPGNDFFRLFETRSLREP